MTREFAGGHWGIAYRVVSGTARPVRCLATSVHFHRRLAIKRRERVLASGYAVFSSSSRFDDEEPSSK